MTIDVSGASMHGPVRSYPAMAAEENRIEPCPRRIRGMLNGMTVFDTTHALYVWEWPGYPQYYVPAPDVRRQFLMAAEASRQELVGGDAVSYDLRVGDVRRERAAQVHPTTAETGVAGTVRFDWEALDAWFEEDEEVFVHPRNPYTRVDALRSRRHLRVEVAGVVLAETTAPVLLFETGLPTRYYVDRAAVRFEHLRPSDARSSCPYKGNTSQYWSAEVDGVVHLDVAWTYDFPTRELTTVAGLVAFFNEDVDLLLDGQPLSRESAPTSSRRTK
ncbi:MAG: DUF427 domain-containing protein [Nocardioidaceae bacterium]